MNYLLQEIRQSLKELDGGLKVKRTMNVVVFFDKKNLNLFFRVN